MRGSLPYAPLGTGREPSTGRAAARVLRWAHAEPERLGRLLLISSCLIIAATAPLLAGHQRDWVGAAIVAGVLGVLAIATAYAPERLLRGPGAALCPLLVMGALVGLSGAGTGISAAYTGLLLLCFGVTGVTATASVNLLLVPPACVTFVVAAGSVGPTLLVRTAIAAFVWILVSQLLCALDRAHAELADTLARAANTDGLTGLANRRALDERLTDLAPGDLVVLCDLDWFKSFNDRFGHQAGDRLLASFGLLLSTRLRSNDYAARYGGEEFAVVLSDTRLADGQAIIERLHATWSALHESVTFSSGLAAHLAGADPGQTLLAADRALYAAKESGRGCSRTAVTPARRPAAAPSPPASAQDRRRPGGRLLTAAPRQRDGNTDRLDAPVVRP